MFTWEEAALLRHMLLIVGVLLLALIMGVAAWIVLSR